MSALIIRYCLMFDDRSEDPKDQIRMAEFIFSLISLKHNLLPFVECEFYIYCSKINQDRLNYITQYLDIKPVKFLIMDNDDDIEFANSIRYCDPVDRICIRRMFLDFRCLPPDRFRLLLGTDIYVLKVPQEVICNTYSHSPYYDVLYLANPLVFNGQLYGLRYWYGSLLPGLVGDFYLLSPKIQISRDSIISALKIIDSWPPLKRYKPDLPKQFRNLVNTCEQQAASIILGQWHGLALPPERYAHYFSKPTTAVLHGKKPWLMPKKIPEHLFKDCCSVYEDLHYKSIIEQINIAQSHEQKPHRKIKHLLWSMTGLRYFI